MLGQRICELRTHLGWSQVELSRRLSVSKQTVSNWENENIQPSIEMLVRLSRLFGVTTDYLTGRSPYRNPVQVLDENDRMLTIDKDTREVLETLRSRPEMKVLFSVSRKASREDVLRAARIIEALREQGEQEIGD